MLVGRGAVIVDIATPDLTAAVNDWPVNCAVEAAVAHKATLPLPARKNTARSWRP